MLVTGDGGGAEAGEMSGSGGFGKTSVAGNRKEGGQGESGDFIEILSARSMRNPSLAWNVHSKRERTEFGLHGRPE